MLTCCIFIILTCTSIITLIRTSLTFLSHPPTSSTHPHPHPHLPSHLPPPTHVPSSPALTFLLRTYTHPPPHLALLLLTSTYSHISFPTSFTPTSLTLPPPSSSTEEEHEQDLMDDEDVVKFHWDGKGRFMDVVKLTACLDEAREAQESMASYRER
jgi:hypothetical protein